MAQDRLLGEKVVEFSGHEGAKTRYAPIHDVNPLAVGARTDNEPRLVTFHDAGDLGFFAAHDVAKVARCGVLGDARNDPDRPVGRRTDHRGGQIGKGGGSPCIGRFDPALPGTDHAAADDRDFLPPCERFP